MASTCLVCGTSLRQSGGITKFCSRGKDGCRRKRTVFARQSILEAAKQVLAGGGPVVYRATSDQVRRFGRKR